MFVIIKCLIFTEKTTRLLEVNKQYVFDVRPNLKKPQVRFLIEKRFSVQVCAINTHRKPRKKRRGKVSSCFLPSCKRLLLH
jgi:ribosomal protein L23